MGSYACVPVSNILGCSESHPGFRVICEIWADAKETVKHETYSRTYHNWMAALHLKLTNKLL
jgi:hypothetical protein